MISNGNFQFSSSVILKAGQVFPPGDIWQCGETLLIVITWQGDTVILWVDYVSDTAKLPTRPRMAPYSKELPSPARQQCQGPETPLLSMDEVLSLISYLHHSVNNFKTPPMTAVWRGWSWIIWVPVVVEGGEWMERLQTWKRKLKEKFRIFRGNIPFFGAVTKEFVILVFSSSAVC